MILFISTATNGFPDFKKRASDPSQPHIVQSSVIMDDIQVTESVKPEGWTIPPETSAIHGITDEAAAKHTVTEKQLAENMLRRLKDATLVVGYNLTFHKYMIRILLRRHGLFFDADDSWFKSINGVCVMREMTPICQLVNAQGKSRFPKLVEAHLFAFRKHLANAGTPQADVKACAELYRWLTTK